MPPRWIRPVYVSFYNLNHMYIQSRFNIISSFHCLHLFCTFLLPSLDLILGSFLLSFISTSKHQHRHRRLLNLLSVTTPSSPSSNQFLRHGLRLSTILPILKPATADTRRHQQTLSLDHQYRPFRHYSRTASHTLFEAIARAVRLLYVNNTTRDAHTMHQPRATFLGRIPRAPWKI